MFWNVVKGLSGFVAGATASKVAKDILVEISKRTVVVAVNNPEETVKVASFVISKTKLANVVHKIGIAAISGAVGAAATKYVVSEIDDIEEGFAEFKKLKKKQVYTVEEYVSKREEK